MEDRDSESKKVVGKSVENISEDSILIQATLRRKKCQSKTRLMNSERGGVVE